MATKTIKTIEEVIRAAHNCGGKHLTADEIKLNVAVMNQERPVTFDLSFGYGENQEKYRLYFEDFEQFKLFLVYSGAEKMKGSKAYHFGDDFLAPKGTVHGTDKKEALSRLQRFHDGIVLPKFPTYTGNRLFLYQAVNRQSGYKTSFKVLANIVNGKLSGWQQYTIKTVDAENQPVEAFTAKEFWTDGNLGSITADPMFDAHYAIITPLGTQKTRKTYEVGTAYRTHDVSSQINPLDIQNSESLELDYVSPRWKESTNRSFYVDQGQLVAVVEHRRPPKGYVFPKDTVVNPAASVHEVDGGDIDSVKHQIASANRRIEVEQLPVAQDCKSSDHDRGLSPTQYRQYVYNIFSGKQNLENVIEK
jgi:hypothetical protein